MLSNALAPERKILCSVKRTFTTRENYRNLLEDVGSIETRSENGAAPECKSGRKREISERKKKTPPISGIVRHDSHLRESRSDPAGGQTRFALVGREQANHSATAAPQQKRQMCLHQRVVVELGLEQPLAHGTYPEYCVMLQMNCEPDVEAGANCVSGRAPHAYKGRNSCKEACIEAEKDWSTMASNLGYDYLPKSTDSSFLCILEPQLCVHWLLPHTWQSWNSQGVSLQVCYWLRGVQGGGEASTRRHDAGLQLSCPQLLQTTILKRCVYGHREWVMSSDDGIRRRKLRCDVQGDPFRHYNFITSNTIEINVVSLDRVYAFDARLTSRHRTCSRYGWGPEGTISNIMLLRLQCGRCHEKTEQILKWVTLNAWRLCNQSWHFYLASYSAVLRSSLSKFLRNYVVIFLPNITVERFTEDHGLRGLALSAAAGTFSSAAAWGMVGQLSIVIDSQSPKICGYLKIFRYRIRNFRQLRYGENEERYCINKVTPDRRMNKVIRPVAMIISYVVDEYTTCVEVDILQGFEKRSVYREHASVVQCHLQRGSGIVGTSCRVPHN
ncbi:hypothetical protein PR048_003603 [Dryococelus australis]|uniref:Uncharacterized protein n=1 Tax=Dryococelus australis TaxID=614101 RepID=A0ABQ9INJ7_9NEOP|nr:hypothetical protein PR048_003603 [Dryococelus australis]